MSGGTHRHSYIIRKFQSVAVGNRHGFLVQRRRRQSYFRAADRNISNGRAAAQAGNRNFSFAAAGRNVADTRSVRAQNVARAYRLGNIIRHAAGNFPVRRRRTRLNNVIRQLKRVAFGNRHGIFTEHRRVQSHNFIFPRNSVNGGAALKPADRSQSISAAGSRITNAPRVAHKIMPRRRISRGVNRHRAADTPVSGRSHRRNDIRAELKRVTGGNVNSLFAQHRFGKRNFRTVKRNSGKRGTFAQMSYRNQRIAGGILVGNALAVVRKDIARRRASANIIRRRAGNIPVSRRSFWRGNAAAEFERVVAGNAGSAGTENRRWQNNFRAAH